MCSLLFLGKHVWRSPKNIFPMLVATFTLNGGLNQIIFLFRILLLLFSSLFSLGGVFISPVVWLWFPLVAFSSGLSLLVYCICCLCPFVRSLSHSWALSSIIPPYLHTIYIHIYLGIFLPVDPSCIGIWNGIWNDVFLLDFNALNTSFKIFSSQINSF